MVVKLACSSHKSHSSSGKYDLVMAVGGAVSQEEFLEQANFLKAILDQFVLSRRKTRVGLIHYGKDAAIIQSLRDSYSKDTTISLIDKMAYSNPGSNLLKALQTADQIFSPGNGERSDAKKVLILFVDSLRVTDIAELERIFSSLTRRNVRIVIVGFETYVQPSAVKLLIGSGRNPVLISNEYKLNDKNVVSQVIGQLGKGQFHALSVIILICMPKYRIVYS